VENDHIWRNEIWIIFAPKKDFFKNWRIRVKVFKKSALASKSVSQRFNFDRLFIDLFVAENVFVALLVA
jgi:hypothetical protein